ncbi:MAG: WD40 repeat domain-containing protein, partial [Treponema sp.]|nr:WD40 repeat domain-containing protein [Treponema sp.]
MKNIIFCCLLIMTASIFTHSQELLLTRGNIITSIEFNQNHSLYAILDGNMLSLFDEDNQFLSIISRDVTCFSWLTKEFIAVAAGQAVSVYDLKDPQNPVRKHTFNAAGTVSALCGDDERIFVGTKTGDIYLINCKDGASQLFTRTRGEALFLMKKNTLLITISDEDMPRVYDINSGFLEGFLTSESNSPVSAVAKNSESIFMGREDGNIHEYYLSFFSDVNLKPKKTWTLPSPVVALSVSDNKDLV